MFRKILVPVDLRREASWRRALPVAAEQAKFYGAGVTVLYVVPAAWPMDPEPHEDDERIARLRALVEEHFDNSSEVEIRAEHHNAPHRSILGIASDEAFDLIVMNSHEPRQRDHLIGSHASEVVGHAQCSVLVVR